MPGSTWRVSCVLLFFDFEGDALPGRACNQIYPGTLVVDAFEFDFELDPRRRVGILAHSDNARRDASSAITGEADWR